MGGDSFTQADNQSKRQRVVMIVDELRQLRPFMQSAGMRGAIDRAIMALEAELND